MNDETTNSDRTEEDTLTHTVSDEAIEAAAGTTAAGTSLNCMLVCEWTFGYVEE